MGTYFNTQSSAVPKHTDSVEDARVQFLQLDRPSMSVQTQMNYIIAYWIRKTSLIHDVCVFPMGVIHIIINTYCYQSMFDVEHQYKCNGPEQYYKLRTLQGPTWQQANYDYSIRMLLIGEQGTGKSSLLTRYCDDTFVDHYQTSIGIDFKIKTIKLNNKTIKLQIWNPYVYLYGQRENDRYNAYKRLLRNLHTAIFVYDITRADSLQCLAIYNDMVDEHALHRVEKMMIGTKSDCTANRMLSQEDAYHFAKERGIAYCMETSARTGQNVEDAFASIGANISQQNGSREKTGVSFLWLTKVTMILSLFIRSQYFVLIAHHKTEKQATGY